MRVLAAVVFASMACSCSSHDGASSGPDSAVQAGSDAAASGAGGGSTLAVADATATEGGLAPGASERDRLYGEARSGLLSIGPVDFAETYFGNACAPYPPPLPTLYGNFLVAVQTSQIKDGQMCDACVRVTSANGKSEVARVINFGGMGEGDIDVSPELNEALGIRDEAARRVTWRFVDCPVSGPIYFKFYDGGHQWYFKVWIRNQRVPVRTVEAKIPGGAYFELPRTINGNWVGQAQPSTDFSRGFSLRVTSIEGTVVERDFPTGTAVYGETIIAADRNL